jgi:hypothetical protein
MDHSVIALVVHAPFAVYYACGLYLFLHYKKANSIQRRYPSVVVLSSLSCIAINVTFVQFGLTRSRLLPETFAISCNGVLVIAYAIGPIWLFTTVLRVAQLFTVYKRQQAALLQSATQQLQDKQHHDTGLHTAGLFDRIAEFWISVILRVIAVGDVISHWCIRLVNSTQRSSRKTSTEHHLTSSNAILATVLLIELTGLFVSALVYCIDAYVLLLDRDRTGCYPHDYFYLYFEVLVHTLLIPVFLQCIRRMKDELWIRKEIVLTFFMVYPSFVLYAIHQYVPAVNRFIPRFFHPLFWVVASGVGSFFVSVYCPVLYHLWQRKHQRLNMASCREVNLDAVLANDKQRKELKTIAARQLAVENVEFLEDLHQLRGTLDKNGAQMLFEKYFISGALMELNVDHSLKMKIERRISDGDVHISMFDDVKTGVKNMLVNNTLNAFIRLNSNTP